MLLTPLLRTASAILEAAHSLGSKQGGSEHLGQAARGLPKGTDGAKPFMHLLPHRRGRFLVLRSVTWKGGELYGNSDSG